MPTVAATAAYRLGVVAPGAYDLNALRRVCYAVGAAADRSGPAAFATRW